MSLGNEAQVAVEAQRQIAGLLESAQGIRNRTDTVNVRLAQVRDRIMGARPTGVDSSEDKAPPSNGETEELRNLFADINHRLDILEDLTGCFEAL